MGNWSDLYDEILELIIDKIRTIEDIIRFRAVCQSWRSVSVMKRQRQRQRQLCPWLMLAARKGSDRRSFYSLSTQKVYRMDLPGVRGRRCWFSQGWLITFGVDMEMHLLNPFSQVRIPLPPQPSLPYQYSPESKFNNPKVLLKIFIKKVVLSSKPSLSVKTTHCKDSKDENCVIMAISSQFNTLAFLRLGDKVWTPIDSPLGFCDIIYFNGQFYAVNTSGRLFICDIYTYFLVESLGELFLIGQGNDHPDFDEHGYNNPDEPVNENTGGYETKGFFGFGVYKFNFDNRKWTHVRSLENRTFFVGNNTSLAVFPSNQCPGCEPNCIYFIDSYHDSFYYGAAHDMGVSWINPRGIQPQYVGRRIFSKICTPLWVGL
ncbi:hypothetical protein NE237_029039 [Protea cynaroides]|uniref:F-box protein n=1 Tax=Protea cynaroides TaxID=273540 RepID=A0A9Q0GQG5_9MAGN|nr:hypothetical protein NE237_029039 [Protea cynaroides]